MPFRRLTAILVVLALSITAAITATDVASAATVDAPEGTSLVSNAIDNSNTTFQLSWAPVTGAVAYSVSLSIDPTFSSGVVTSVTYTNSVTPGAYLATIAGQQTIYWRVASYAGSVASANLGSYSDVESLARQAIAAPVPVAPLGTTVSPKTVVYPAAVSFSWSPVVGAQSYTVSYSQSASFASAVTTVPNVAGTSFTPTATLSRDATWYWRVSANVLAYSFVGAATTTIATATSTPQAFATPWDDPATLSTDESQPQLLSQHDESTLSTTWLSDPILSWSPVSGASSYQLTLGNAKQNDQITSPTIYTVYGTTFIPPTLLADHDYYWQVTAIDSGTKKGTPSSIWEFHKAWGAQSQSTSSTLAGTTAPVALTGSTTLGAPISYPIDRFQLQWNPVPRATQYVVSVYKVTNGVPSSNAAVTCTTASTTATIVSAATAVLPSSVSGLGSCLWNASTGLVVSDTVVYKWGVLALQKDANGGTSITTASSYDVAPRYFTLAAGTDGATFNPNSDSIVGDEDAWTEQTVDAKKGQPAPLFTWEPVHAAQVYQVEVSLNRDFTTVVARFWTPDTILRPTGVFADTNTQLPYYWRVKAGTTTSSFASLIDDQSAWPLATDPAYDWRQWKKTSTPASLDADTAVTQANGSTVLRWVPQSVSAPNDGGSAGYVVKIYSGSSATGTPVNGASGVKTINPFLVAATSGGLPLIENGTYTFTVAAMDANGTAGNASTPFTFKVDAQALSRDDLSAKTDGGSGSAVLSWAPTPGALTYSVTVTPPTGITSVNGTGSGDPVTYTGLSQTALTVTGLSGASSAYTFTVTPIKQGNIPGATSDSKSFTVPLATIQQTTADGQVLHAYTSSTDVGRTLSWTPVPGASMYAVTITVGGTPTISYVVAPRGVVVTSASYGSAYTWSVVALAGSSTGSTTRTVLATSATRSFTTLTVPATPVVTATVSGTTVTANWTALSTPAAVGASAPVTYIVQRRVKPVDGSNDWSSAFPYPTGSGTTSYAMTGLDMNVTYQVRLAAVNSEGQSGWSAAVDAKTASFPTAAPVGLRATPSLGGFTVAWTAVPTAANGGTAILGYYVRYKGTGAASWAGQVTTTSPSTTLTGLVPGASYDFAVSSYNVVGEGPEADISAVALALPGAPTGLSAVRGDKTVTLAWAPPASNGGSAITSYSLQQSVYDSKAKTWGAWTAATTTATTLVRSSLVNGTAYQYRVAAVSKLGTSAFSAVATATPAGKPIVSAKAIKVTASKGKFVIKWSAATSNGSAITGYVVQYGTNGKKWTTLKTAKSSVRSYTTKKGKKGKTYYFRIVPKNALGSGIASKTVTSKRK